MSDRSNRRTRKRSAAPVSSGFPFRKAGAFAALFAAAVLLVVAISQMTEGTSGESAQAAPADSAEDEMIRTLAGLARRDAADPQGRGAADAPVVMIEYSDFQCPYCKQFAEHIEPQLVSKYLASGQLRIEWRNLALFGEESELAARAAWAAGQQGRFREMHDLLFAHAPAKKNSGVYTVDRVVEWAARAGVADLDKFRADLDSAAARAAVQADVREALSIGVNSTPAFLINGRPVLGARPVEQMTAAIESALRAAPETSK